MPSHPAVSSITLTRAVFSPSGTARPIVFGLALLASPYVFARPAQVRLERSVDAMGTTFTVDIYGDNQGTLQAAAQSAFDELYRLDQMLSNYLPDSELSQVNAHAAAGPVKVSREMFDLLEACVD